LPATTAPEELLPVTFIRQLLFLLAGALVATVAILSSRPSDFTSRQRDAVIGIVRDAMRSDPSILREAVQTLIAENDRESRSRQNAQLAEYHAALTRDPADPVAGNPNGDVDLVEFYDLRCPYCRNMSPVLAEFLAQDPGVRLIYKDIPILGAPSMLAARAVLAAQAQGGYRRLQHALLALNEPPTLATVQAAAKNVKLDADRLTSDMDSAVIQTRLDDNVALAKALGISGTPTFVAGQQLISGALDVPSLKRMVGAARQHASVAADHTTEEPPFDFSGAAAKRQ
jgi:protein-disulfide isomerase